VQTWDEVAKMTRAAIEAVEAGREDFAVLTLANTDSYVQWTLEEGALHLEVSSNEVLGAEVLPPAALDELASYGVEVTDPDPNYLSRPASVNEAIELVVRILQEVFEVQPSQVADIELG
jgi:hypothetical protein